MKLVIVESPTKAKTITRFLGPTVQVIASQGHVRDLPERAIGIDIEHDFKPAYELTANGKRIVPTLKKAAQQAEAVYLATDPDREGEAISWHILDVLKKSAGAGVPFHRITFHEITNSAIQNSMAHPGQININMVDAQQARRVLDRIVGYQVSPMLWRSIRNATSAGRVQTVALRLVVEREREIQQFVPVESWNLEASFSTRGLSPDATFKARLAAINGNAVKIGNGELAAGLADAIQSAGVTHKVTKVTSTPRSKNPAPPFITSTLQQAAGSNLGLGASQTMRVAQELYEGINLGSGQVGLITYMRTDSFNIAVEAQNQARDYIRNTYGPEYVPAKPNTYRAGRNAQEAHEAIRPTDMSYAPDAIKQYLTLQQYKVYTLIWNRFLASQMVPARQMDHLIEVESSGGLLDTTPSKDLTNAGIDAPGSVCQFRATARETTFPGFMRAYSFRDLGEEDDPALNTLPKPPTGTVCNLNELSKEQSFSQPPPRYTEATLVKALEQNGVGRPSTYATTVNTIQERGYVEKDRRALKPTELGCKACDFLTTQVQKLFEVKFTADMETQLDQIEEGKMNWITMLRDFYGNFQNWMGMKQMNAESPLAQKVADILQCFPENFHYSEPVKMGTRKYDDAQFIHSIRKRLEENTALSAHQWKALLTTAVKYSEEHPEIMDVLVRDGLEEEIKPLMENRKKLENTPKEEVAPAIVQLLKTMMDDVRFKEPVKRPGKKVYDDGKFVKSLFTQVTDGRNLSAAQAGALLKLASSYSGVIKNYAELVTAFKAALPEECQAEIEAKAPAVEEAEPSEELKREFEALMEMLGQIKEWKPARGRFDDHTFAESVQEQYGRKKSLSPKQAAAIGKLLGKYVDQIPGAAERLAKMTCLSAPKPKPEVMAETCPLCGANLVKRFSRGHSFVGCSAFPKCRFIKK